jgi:PhzF family phenazine biosynthesis protein
MGMKLLRIAAFSDADQGGNPAGVVITDSHPDETEMRRIATEVGYSETAFAMPQGDAWRVRYFSPSHSARRSRWRMVTVFTGCI